MTEKTRTRRSTATAPTLSDVAREAQVSLATASRALNGSIRNVSEDNRQRVEAAAEKLGYTANLSAQATARGTSAVITLLVADIADPYFGLIASGITREAERAGLMVTIGITDRDPDRELALVRSLRGQRPRGLILAASRPRGPLDPKLAHELVQLERAGGRAVVFGSEVPGHRHIEIDNQGGARQLALALGARGYRRAVVLAAADGTTTSDKRVTGFIDGFTTAGGEDPRIYRGTFSRESGRSMMEQVLRDGVDPGTIIFGVSDVIAVGAYTTARNAGRAPGTDLAFAGFGDIPAGLDIAPTLTTVRIPLEKVGAEAFDAATTLEWSFDASGLAVQVLLRESTPDLT